MDCGKREPGPHGRMAKDSLCCYWQRQLWQPLSYSRCPYHAKCGPAVPKAVICMFTRPCLCTCCRDALEGLQEEVGLSQNALLEERAAAQALNWQAR